jgi:hypothetical protein
VALGGDGRQALGRRERVLLVLDGARASDQDERPAADPDPVDRDDGRRWPV